MHTLLLLPLGLLPVGLLIYYFFFKAAEATVERHVLADTRRGIEEYPTMMSHMGDKIVFPPNSKNITVTTAFNSHLNYENALDELWRKLHNVDWQLEECFVKQHTVESVVHDGVDNLTKITYALSDEALFSAKYIDYEISHLGSVWSDRSTVNDSRRMFSVLGERRVERRDGRTFVHIDRLQHVSGLFDAKTIIMSERQITRNIKNRLWNRFEVKCVSCQGRTYVGELTPL